MSDQGPERMVCDRCNEEDLCEGTGITYESPGQQLVIFSLNLCKECQEDCAKETSPLALIANMAVTQNRALRQRVMELEAAHGVWRPADPHVTAGHSPLLVATTKKGIG